MKKLILIICFTLGAILYSQTKNSLEMVNLNQSQSITNQNIMIEYLIKRKELEDISNNKYEGLIITEIFGGVDSDDGICLFTTNRSHSKKYIFLELKGGNIIMNINKENLNITLQQIIIFAREKQFDNKKESLLIQRILELFGREK